MHQLRILFRLMVFNVTFNNISVISWRSDLLVGETGAPEENHRPVQVTDKLCYLICYTSPSPRFELTTSVVIGTDCIDSCKFNYQTITVTTAPTRKVRIYSYDLSIAIWNCSESVIFFCFQFIRNYE